MGFLKEEKIQQVASAAIRHEGDCVPLLPECALVVDIVFYSLSLICLCFMFMSNKLLLVNMSKMRK